MKIQFNIYEWNDFLKPMVLEFPAVPTKDQYIMIALSDLPMEWVRMFETEDIAADWKEAKEEAISIAESFNCQPSILFTLDGEGHWRKDLEGTGYHLCFDVEPEFLKLMDSAT